jgi:uncharacterized protein (DUF488 family)
MSDISIFTIGFTKKTARSFFTKLKDAGVKTVVDVRLNNVSQLAGFSKKDDLQYFLKEIAGIDYIHLPELAPTQGMLDEYKKMKGSWSVYHDRFLDLMASRHIENTVPKDVLDQSCLLCSEDSPHYCHRRLVAEYLQRQWGNTVVHHIK